MERLSLDAAYDPVEAAIHVGRYALALPFARGRRVLDVACGEGYGTFLLARAGAGEAVGLDVAAGAVAAAAARFRHPKLRFAAAAGAELGALLPPSHFDLVVSIETIEHVADPAAFLHALKRLATPDAVILLTCPNDHWYYRDGGANPHHRHRFCLDEFQRLATGILGEGAQWLLGSATLGFGAAPLAPAPPPRLEQAVPTRLELRVPAGADAPTAADCSYFAGIWGAPPGFQGAGAHHALSMDAFARMRWRDVAVAELDRLRATLAAQGDAAREQEILDQKAATLLRETEILSGSLASAREEGAAREAQAAASLAEAASRLADAARAGAALEARLAAALALQARTEAERDAAREAEAAAASERDATRLERDAARRETAATAHRLTEAEAALAWHVARVRSLDEALQWHVARLHALESEPATRLIRRAVGRVLRAASPARIAARRRRGSDG